MAISKKKFRRITLRKTGMEPAVLALHLKLDQQFAMNFYAISAAVADPAFRRVNPDHPRHDRRRLGLSPRQQRYGRKGLARWERESEAYDLALIRGSRADVPFDSIELDEGRACFGGRC